LGTIAIYIVFTLVVTEWRTVFRRSMNDLDSRANAKAIDALINYETVKYFNNEAYEAERYDRNLAAWEASAIKNQVSLSMLNAGQGIIIASGVTLIMVLAARSVVQHQMTVGDVVLVATFITQLYTPLNFLGFIYREIKHSLADIERMFGLLSTHQEVDDVPGAKVLASRKPASASNRWILAMMPSAPFCTGWILRFRRAVRWRWWGKRGGQVHAGPAAVPFL
jgi:ATP-binding cassette subfamily B protein